MATQDELTANLEKVVGGDTKLKATPAKAKAAKAKGEAKAPSPRVVQLPPPMQPGAKCLTKDCTGRYSVLASGKVGGRLVHDLICRTCQKKPPGANRQPEKKPAK